MKALLPTSVQNAIHKAVFPYRHGNRFFRPYVVRGKAMEGETFDLYIGNREGRAWYDRPCINNPVWREMGFMRDYIVAKGDVVFEVGGHHGVSAILLSRWVGPSGRVVTFEPVPSHVRFLRENVHLNRLSNVTVKGEAVGASPGTILFDESASGVAVTSPGIPVTVSRLDDYADLAPTLLKIDVEGFEVAVLEGAQRILTTRPKLAIEIHADQIVKYGASVAEIFQLIEWKRYRIWLQERDDQMPTEYTGPTPPPIHWRGRIFCL